MTVERAIGVRQRVCLCVRDHRPDPQSLDWHHIQPLSWQGPDTADNLITLCPSTHRNVHELLRACKAFGRPDRVPWEILDAFG